MARLNQRQRIQQFLGLINYYSRFIEDFAKFCEPIIALLKKNVTFSWFYEAQVSFDTLNSKFTSIVILSYPNCDLLLMVETDSNNFAIGVILS